VQPTGASTPGTGAAGGATPWIRPEAMTGADPSAGAQGGGGAEGAPADAAASTGGGTTTGSRGGAQGAGRPDSNGEAGRASGESIPSEAGPSGTARARGVEGEARDDSFLDAPVPSGTLGASGQPRGGASSEVEGASSPATGEGTQQGATGRSAGPPTKAGESSGAASSAGPKEGSPPAENAGSSPTSSPAGATTTPAGVEVGASDPSKAQSPAASGAPTAAGESATAAAATAAGATKSPSGTTSADSAEGAGGERGERGEGSAAPGGSTSPREGGAPREQAAVGAGSAVDDARPMGTTPPGASDPGTPGAAEPDEKGSPGSVAPGASGESSEPTSTGDAPTSAQGGGGAADEARSMASSGGGAGGAGGGAARGTGGAGDPAAATGATRSAGDDALATGAAPLAEDQPGSPDGTVGAGAAEAQGERTASGSAGGADSTSSEASGSEGAGGASGDRGADGDPSTRDEGAEGDGSAVDGGSEDGIETGVPRGSRVLLEVPEIDLAPIERRRERTRSESPEDDPRWVLRGAWEQVNLDRNGPDFAPGGYERSLIAVDPHEGTLRLYRAFAGGFTIAGEFALEVLPEGELRLAASPDRPHRFAAAPITLPSGTVVEPPVEPLEVTRRWSFAEGELDVEGRRHRRIDRATFEQVARGGPVEADAGGAAGGMGPATSRTVRLEEEEPAAVDFFGTSIVGRYVCFIVDVSGSMEGARLQAALAELAAAIDALPPDRSFYVLFFSGSKLVLEDRWTRATTRGKRAFIDRLAGVAADGGTEPASAIEHAFRMLAPVPDEVHFMTDGLIPAQTPAVFSSLNGGRVRTVVHTYAFGEQASEAMLREIAREHGGTYRFVPE